MNLHPVGDRIIVRAIDEDSITASGLVLPDIAKEKPQKGEIVAVGEGRRSEHTGEFLPIPLAVGDEVLYTRYGGTEIKVDGEDLLVLREADVLCMVREAGPYLRRIRR